MTRDLRSNMSKRWPLGIAVLIGLFASLPLLRGIPDGADTLLHFYRTVQLELLFDEGVLFTPWAPDFAYGFGYPIFNYYAPLTYYLASFFAFLGVDILVALQGVFVLSLVLASLFTFLWVSDLFGDSAGLVASAMYALSPYLLVDAVNRGALPELLALALLPFILWTIRRYFNTGSWPYGAASLFAFSALVLTHNITALVFTPVLIGYVLVVTFARHKDNNIRVDTGRGRLVKVAWFLLLGLALSAFFWMPALLERNLVQIEQVVGPSDFNYENNFLAIAELFALPYQTDLNLINQEVPIALSLLALILGLTGLASFRHYRRQPARMGEILFAGGITGASLFMTLSSSSLFWEVIPLLRFLQFPWRFLGLAALFLAFLCGAGTTILLEFTGRYDRVKTIGLGLLIAAAAIYIIPWQFTNYNDPPPEDSAAAIIDFELDSGYLGTTSTGEYLPIGVRELPARDQIEAGGGDKLQSGSLPPGARLKGSEYHPLNYSLVIETPAEFLAVFNTFFFEGWQAKIDGQPVPIMATGSNGLIGVLVPEGRHELQVFFGATPVRRFAAFVSIAALLLTGATIFVMRRRVEDGDPEGMGHGDRLPRNALLFAAAALLLVALVKLIYFDGGENAFLRTRFDGRTIEGADAAVSANFDDQLFLIGVDQPDEAISGEPAAVTLYWHAGPQVEKDYSVSAVLVDGNGIEIAQSDRQHPGVQPTSRWKETDYAADRHQLVLAPGTPPGEYELQVAVYEYGRPDNRLNVLDPSGMPAGQSVDVTTLSVARPKRPADLDGIETAQLTEHSMGNDFSLVGYSLPAFAVRAGDLIYPVFYWRAETNPAQDHLISVVLVGENGRKFDLLTSHPLKDFPTSEWREDDVWRSVYPLLLPPTLESGTYSISVGLVGEEGRALATVEVESPAHNFDQPESAYRDQVRFGNVAVLAGYDVVATAYPGELVEAVLIWQAAGQTRTSYKTFIQLLDQEGRLVSGSDMIPGNWRRPTTGWIEGEYIVDEHELAIPVDLPLGTYSLLVGIYDESDLTRLITEFGQDSWLLPQAIEVTSH